MGSADADPAEVPMLGAPPEPVQRLDADGVWRDVGESP